MSHAHTIRHLRPTQVYHQVRQRLLAPRPVLSVVERPRLRKFHFVPWIQRQKSYLGKNHFQFLNKEKSLGCPVDWNATDCSHLWRYNLHYFDYLHQQGIDRSVGFELIRDWMKGHPAVENRVGRRGYPKGLLLEDHAVRCSHTGFEIWKKGLGHTRTIKLSDDGFEISDRVEGPGKHSYKTFFHFSPEAKVGSRGKGYLVNERLSIIPSGAESRLTTSEYYPEFGRVEERPCLVLEGEFSDSSSFGVRCTYSS